LISNFFPLSHVYLKKYNIKKKLKKKNTNV
jgi:hypothetical protein